MKTTKFIFLTLLITLLCMSAKAQQRNVLIVPDVITPIGNVQLPINIENTDEVVGMQFDITLPEGITAQPVANLTNRSDGHIANVSKLKSGAYRILLYSGTNRPLLGQSGVVMYLPIVIPDSYEEGSEHQITISNATLGKSSGENVITEAIAGKIRISKLPDLTIKNVIIDKQVLSPGERVVCSWQVENIGELDTDGGWSEQLSLVSNDGTISKLIATTHYDDILTAGGIVSRQTEVTLPYLLAIDGDVKLQVRLVPDINTGEPASAQANNTQTCDNILTVNKQLGIELSPKRIDENSGQRIALRVNRSGRWTTKETFAITATNDSRLNVPSSITIPANQSGAVVYISVTDNEVLDNDSIVNISVEGNGYAEATSTLVIDDNELPTLSVSSSKTEVNEGETFQLTITTSRTSSSPIVVKLTSESSRRFTFPQQVVIPANESSVTIDVVAIDNDEIELKESIAFRALADKHESGECIIMLDDNDMPTLSFTLSPEAVSESDGYAALLGVIKRTDNLDKKVTLKLSDDSNGLLTYSSQSIVLAKNQAEVQFSIGVTDNDLVDGNHIVNVTAAVYASSCDCSVSGNNKGNMTAAVTIIDDDGPALKIKPAGTAMLEGSEGNVFAVSHNVKSDVDVTVHISSDKDDMLEYNHELTIPAGQNSANLNVSVKGNDLQDDSSIATFKAESNGYSLGTCWILITDQTLPDATVSLYADKTEVEAEQTVFLRAVVKNMGNAPLHSTTPVEISFSGRSEKVKLTVGKNVAVGDSAIIEYNYDLPAITGEHIFEATVNASGKVPELIYANNTSEKLSLSIIPPFSVTAQADKDIYHQSDSIYISGKATGSAGKNSKIEVYFINEGSRLTVNATSDDEGNFIAVWKPLSKQSGHFIVGACYPGSKATEEMDAFDVYGVRTKDYFKTCELSQSESTSGKIVLTNPGNLAQTGLKVTLKAESENCEFTFDAPTAIGAGESVEISYSLKANEISEGKDWQQMPIEITTAEGSITNYTIYYYVHSLKARIEASKTSINTTMTYGTPREYPVTIRNVGKAETGKITLSLPNWIQAVTPSEMASLAQGDSATVLLRFIPTEAMKLNVRVSGRIGINCANGDGTSISFNLTPVSEAKGKLKVDVVDEYTYFTTEAPHVSKAKVSVKNPSTNEVVAEGETADDGTFTAEIPEGYYSVTVDADKHDSYANTVIVDPGVEKEEEVFLSYQAITYSWNVEETTVEDEYEIETIVKYETRVPKPVVIVTLPDEQPEPNSIIPVILTNKGLVNAVDVNLSLSISNGYTLEFLNAPSLEVLAPQQSHVFYAKMVPETEEEEPAARARRASSNNLRCFTLIARAKYKELCQKYTGEELAEQIKKWGTQHCVSSGSGGGSRTGGSYGPGYPGNWGKTNYDSYYRLWDTDDPAKFCDKVLNEDEDVFPDPNDDVPEEDEEVDDCEKDKPIFNFALVSSKNGKKRNGVAADGLSNVKIILSKGSKKPKEECGYTYKWTLSPNIGELSNYESLDNIIYKAPDDFPINTDNKNKCIVKAILTYTKDGISQQANPVEIEIIRVPLALIHGLNSSDSCWVDYYRHLISMGLYEKGWQIKNVDYRRTHNSHFSVNYRVATNAINDLKISCLDKGYEVTQVDLVGHSMGGILSRFHVQQNRKQNDVHKLITVNTPHSGSEIGDIATIDPLFGAAAWSFGFRPLDAVHDLAVNSSAIDNDLNGSIRYIGSGVPVHAITTTSPLKTAGVGGLIAILSKLILMYNHIGEYTLYLGDSDAIVSRESQEGGCEAVSHFDGPMHTESPKDGYVWSRLTSLLCGSTNSFSTNWFTPNNRTFIPIPIPRSKTRANVTGSYQKVDINANVEDDSLIVNIDKDGLFREHLLCASFGDEDIQVSDTVSLKCKVPTTFAGNIKVLAICKDFNGSISIDSTFVNIPETSAQLTSIYADHISVMKNDSIIVTANGIWADGSETTIIPELVEPDEKLAKFSEGKLIGV
ncbi:MAG: alpha/beta hydrolase, partial [Prevotella sp.]|nr:alpha/beta hydrolase [Prevotella sp.]